LAIAPQDNSAFMREVDEEVRKEQAVQFWQRWGQWVAGLVIIALAAFGGWLYWNHSQTTAAEDEVEQLSQLLDELNDGNTENADAVLAELAQSSRPGIRAEAMLTQAAIAMQNDEDAEAVRIYGAIAADGGLPQPFRDLALIRQTAVEFEDMEPQAVIDRLAGLAIPGNPWFGSAGELTAAALIAQGNTEQAGEIFAQIANDETVPDTLRTRAVQMAGVLGVDAVPDEPVEMQVPQPAAAPGAAPGTVEDAGS
jgi:hypothetical protein